jgi:aspartate racemase
MSWDPRPSSYRFVLVNAGAELLVLRTNTMHKLADAIPAAIDVPFVHIADTTAASCTG